MISKLFEPVTAGPMTLDNRVVMTAMHLGYTPGGAMTDRFIDFYAARARGGAGLIVVGGAEINEEASGLDTFLSIKRDEDIPGLKRFVDAIHKEGAKVGIQLYMAGAYSFASFKGLPVFAPSSYVSAFSRQQTTPMTLEDIERVQNDFAVATKRAKEAGFDAVEILGSAGYLICQFLSPKTNNRDDEYGGSLENRMRFGVETVEKVKEAAGDSVAVMIRIAGNDFVPDSHTNEESRAFAGACQDAGVDLINVTGGWHESRVPQITMDLPQAGYVYLARGVKEAVDVPVVGCNRINDPLIAEFVLEEGIADLVGVARGLIADPEFVNKAKRGAFDEIRRCVACNQRCFDHVFQLKPVGCMVNPRAGLEKETEITKTDGAKKIMVVGAGPAGCEFAITAAQRGHNVTLIEKENYLGGQVFWAAESTGKPELMNLFRYYNTMLNNLGIEVRLGVEATPELVQSENLHMVVVATGAAPFEPPIEAVKMPNVVQAWDVLKGIKSTGKRVVVVGGGSVGLETAVYLASIGTISPEQLYFLTLHSAESPETLKKLITKGTKEVTVLEMGPKFGQDVGPSTRWVLMKDLRERDIKLISGATMKEIHPDKVVYTDANGQDVDMPADTVVLAMGARPESSLAESLKDIGVEVAIIGDAAKVGRIGNAVEAGFKLALNT